MPPKRETSIDVFFFALEESRVSSPQKKLLRSLAFAFEAREQAEELVQKESKETDFFLCIDQRDPCKERKKGETKKVVPDVVFFFSLSLSALSLSLCPPSLSSISQAFPFSFSASPKTSERKKKLHTMPPAPVPETALKKRRRDEEWAAARATAAAEARAKRAASRADAFKRAESYVKEYRAQVRWWFFGFFLFPLSRRVRRSSPVLERKRGKSSRKSDTRASESFSGERQWQKKKKPLSGKNNDGGGG